MIAPIADTANSGILARLVDWIGAVRTASNARQVLNRLDDHMLADIGLTRSMINDFAADLAKTRSAEATPSFDEDAREALTGVTDRLLADIGVRREQVALVADDLFTRSNETNDAGRTTFTVLPGLKAANDTVAFGDHGRRLRVA